MSRRVVLLAVTLALFWAVVASAQTPNSSTDDSAAIRDTVTNYIEGYFTGDAARMERTLHPYYLKHIIHGDISMRERTGAQMMKEVRAIGVPDMPATHKTEQVTVLDVSGVIASAKLVTPEWTDYITLNKVDGRWEILSVVQRIDD
ncbi:MAG TPA: nuclear transport factor 2 family protein [Candidatus Eisenbacteria bacterium]|nr:nuclear transport factor 2 family protein [Candidatus Eisenbacteria bacterium]